MRRNQKIDTNKILPKGPAGHYIQKIKNVVALVQMWIIGRKTIAFQLMEYMLLMKSKTVLKNYYVTTDAGRGQVTRDLQNGRFLVSIKDSEEMALPKELMRAPHEWINQNWVPSNRDRFSELPDDILLHILDFMETKEAVQTCVLSKRWQHLCKGLTNLIYYTDSDDHKTILIERFKKFASWIVFSRDISYSLHNLVIADWTDPELLDKVIKHALFCNVQHLTLDLISGFRPNFESLPLIFCCTTLTSLHLCHGGKPSLAVLPKSLHLPAVKSLHLECFQFTPSDDDSAEPFSNCFLLNTLALQYCSLPNDAHVLRISNSILSSLTISVRKESQIVLSTPNICSFTISGNVGHQLFSTCNFPFLGEVCIDVDLNRGNNEHISVMMEWLQLLANVKTLAFNSRAFETILYALPYLILAGPQPPCFVRLGSLLVNKHLFPNISRVEVDTLVKYLLQNSPMDRIDIISV